MNKNTYFFLLAKQRIVKFEVKINWLFMTGKQNQLLKPTK